MERKNEMAMFDYLKGATKKLCEIEPEDREEIELHIEALNSFSGMLHKAAELDSGERYLFTIKVKDEDDFSGLINRVQERTEEMAEKLELYKENLEETEEHYPEELLIDELNMEICGVIQNLARLELEVRRMKEKTEQSSNMSFRCLLNEDLNTVQDMIKNVALCGCGVKLRLEGAVKGYLDE